MNTVRTRLLVPLAVVAALSLGPALSGCGIVGDAVENATGGSVSVDGSLPDSWPSEVPVVDGKVLVALSGQGADAKGWVVTIDASGTDPVADAKQQLLDAGFTEKADATAPEGSASFAALTNGTYDVVVAGSEEGLVYTVTPVS